MSLTSSESKKLNAKEKPVTGLKIDEVMDEAGTLSELVGGYHARAPQVEMAYEIEQLIDAEETLLAEAGTGTGKTFAYLVPALLSGKTGYGVDSNKDLTRAVGSKRSPYTF